ncbi:MAG: hypothetical protein IJS52_07430, partial [Bacilli bacterium]|nr:hypothetical protein [Bacilli bacterium]
DYVRWYEVKMRKSNYGRSFRLHNVRYVYMAISGKHLKVYLALDPAKYENSTIPVKKVESQKYADVPCLFKVRSDLSYRRAKQLIDDAMATGGIAKPEGPAPKEHGSK